MNNLSALFSNEDYLTAAEWLTGTVVENTNTEMTKVSVQQDKKIYVAYRAFSCIIQPEVGDQVCLLRDERSRIFVTSILLREIDENKKEADTTLSFAGKLTINAVSGLSFKTKKTIEMGAEKFYGTISEVHWLSKLMKISSHEIRATLDKTQVTSRIVDFLSQRLQINAERSYRNISESEHVRGKVFDIKAEQVFQVRARCAVVKGKELVKVDASQVHIG